jgi:hypothetical protein
MFDNNYRFIIEANTRMIGKKITNEQTRKKRNI